MNVDDLNMSFNEFPTCPHCRHEHHDVCEFTDEGVYYCESCDEEFFVSPEIEVTYSTDFTTKQKENRSLNHEQEE